MHPSTQDQIAKAPIAKLQRRAGIGGRVRSSVTRVTAVTAAGAAAAALLWLAGPANAAPAPRPAVTGHDSVQVVGTSPSGPLSFIARGPDAGTGVDHPGNKGDTFVYSGGGTEKVLASKGSGPQTLDPKTCLLTVRQHGTYKILGGTGKFAGISGHGTYQVYVLAVEARSGGKCTGKKPPLGFQEIIRASGMVSF
jgi:hypothetical protein